jgi:hypothetical protein
MHLREIGKAFTHVPTDLHRILALDGIDVIPALPGHRPHSHDLHGPQQEIVVKYEGYRWRMPCPVHEETAKLITITRNRDDLIEIFPGCRFMLPTRTDTRVVVGLIFNGRTVLARAGFGKLDKGISGNLA